VRQPSIEVPVATYTGWALRRAPFAEGEDCALTGQYIPFELTRAERLAKGDPRLSIEERYRNHAQYVSRVARAADRLVRQRLLLEEDAESIIEEAVESDVGK
jgi:Alpha/beta hydrolase domain